MSETISDAWTATDIRDAITRRADLNDDCCPETLVDDVAADIGIETEVVSEQLRLLEENGFVYLVPADVEASEQTVKLP